MAGSGDEFAEFNTDEVTFDAMMATAEPAEIVAARHTIIVEQYDDTRFTVTVPAGTVVSVGRSTPEYEVGRASHSPERRPPYRREALAS